ncbi:MAG TPA: pyridoxamine 5'-phosphate oxidase [Phycisphaerales bacterium]|nr:pyridoxamine 5'-phosphate oxidase [Phycisphaerales bacterium]
MSTYESFESSPTLPDPLPAEPFSLFRAWFEEAAALGATPNPNAMTLATIDPDGRPSARIVLCKGIDAPTGCLVFFTNYESRKGRALDANPRAATVFHWDHAERQARIEGAVQRSSPGESDAYFASRPWESRLGAWASDQSRPIASREALLRQAADKVLELGIDLGAAVRGDPVEIPRPPHWGGYRLIADRVELWVGGAGRLHDRACWERPPGGTGPWRGTRLQP